MAKDLSRLRRRPLLAPLLLPMLGLLAAAGGLYWLRAWDRTTTIVLLRHAETATTAGDPELSAAGTRRAALLGELIADLLPHQRVDYLYAADTRRAQQTAAPVANQFQLPINVLTGSDWASLAGRLAREHHGRTVVVVGYASTLPAVVEGLSGQGVAIGPDEFDALFVVVRPASGEPRVLRLRYGEPSPDRAVRPGRPAS
jgi:phosphohistidine phosphatase SixA